ncbi:MAG: hypothetical protein PUP93_30005 [Rhizonema sp. NSF051]|nr:hypothetical protein [Rhizonema sp. NSF051]
MKLSEQCSKNIDHLADTIARLVARYPSQSQYMHAFFRKHYERLKSQSDDLATQYDLEFINQLGDAEKVPDHTRKSIAALIDLRPANNSDWLQGQIDELFKIHGYSDRELLNQIKNLVQSKPENAVALMDKTLNLCENLIGQLTCFTRMSS